MELQIVNNNYVYMNNIIDRHNNILWDKMTFVDPNSKFMNKNRPWQGKFRKYDLVQKRCLLTFLPRIVHICKSENLPFSIDDLRDKWNYPVADPNTITADYLPKITLEDYQIASIKKALQVEFGIFKLTTGAGKTEIIAGICKAINCPTVILADMTVVVSQLKERLQLRNVAEEIGLFFAGEKPNGEMIVVGSVQSLAAPTPVGPSPSAEEFPDDNKYQKALQKWHQQRDAYNTRKKNYKFLIEYVQKAEMLIVDECDRSASDTYKKVIRTHFKGRRKYGFSATPYDDAKPIKNINVEENFGPIVFEMNRKEVEERGRIIPCKYRSIVYEDPNFDLHNKITLDEATNMFMIENQRFHDIIFGICNVHKGERNMILTERIPLGENLLARAQTLGLNARFIYGSTPKSERDRIIAEFAAGQLDVLIGGKIVNRGLDIKGGVDNLIVATGGKLRSDFLQKIGRALRVNNRGFSYVYDFLFRCNHYLYEHSKARLATIIDAGYESKVLFGYANLDGKEFVRRNYQPPARPRSGRGRETQKTLFHQRDCGMEAD